MAGIRFEVLAPSRLQRPAGERVKTDARDALHLAKLLRLDEFTAVRVPSLAEEAARDLVRAREGVAGAARRHLAACGERVTDVGEREGRFELAVRRDVSPHGRHG
ncbi:hypothetical protein ACSNOJ_08145 [Streptomyces sp. URMC 128]|uniref:hypothetical protein n=1 Tax=Streptomyces sp. URMC 128 TaxID=3423404 RepID=UPI003F1A668E